ncbi:MAG: hypothetical protein M9934_14115 [Thermomicrobiales bacterium]|nr:hypothetical protein [Thermomicrobiales bacterium]MCO5219557.1 hypothetical protein [Thermomicrobiales bacterium]MCO5229401.1 hypothetical protein [Thermomicrobiales bacterium]
MTTRPQIRTMLRIRLQDETADPLWEDEVLNDAISEAVRRYSTSMPRQAVSAIAVLHGDQEVEMPLDVNVMRIVRLFDDKGQLIPRWEGSGDAPPAPGGAGATTWRAWANSILLGQVATRSGVWRVEHLVHRVPPTDDINDLDIQPNDEDIIVALALSVALSRRAIAEGKRYTGKSGVHPLAAAARSAQVDADRMFWSRTHKMRVGSFAESERQ